MEIRRSNRNAAAGVSSHELGTTFSKLLLEAQEEGLALVIYERQQTVYHVTVARTLEGEAVASE